MESEHVPMYEPAYRNLYPNGEPSRWVRATCRCGWKSKREVETTHEATLIWMAEHWDEQEYAALRAHVHGKTFRQEWDEIKNRLQTQHEENQQYNLNPFGE